MPTALYQLFSGAYVERSHPRDYPEGVSWIYLEAYAASIWKNRRDISLVRELWDLAKRLRKVRAGAYFDWRDPSPSFIQALAVPRRLRLARNHGKL